MVSEMRAAAVVFALCVAIGCRKEKRDAREAGSVVVSTGALDAPPDSAALRQTPGTLPLPKGAAGSGRATYSARSQPGYTTAPPGRTGEQVRRFDPPPESLKVAPAEPPTPTRRDTIPR